MLFKKFFSCCDSKVDDEIHNDGRNYQICGEFAVGTKLSKDLRKFSVAYVTIQHRNPDDPNLVWRRVFLCSVIVGGNGNMYISGVSPYSFNANSSLNIGVNPDNEIVSISLQGNEYGYQTDYVSIIAVGVIE